MYTLKIGSSDLPKHSHGLGVKYGWQDNSSDVRKLMICNYPDRNKDINGDSVGQTYNPIGGIQQGTLVTSPNLINPEDFTSVSSKDTIILDKLPPCITLRYIRKKNTE